MTKVTVAAVQAAPVFLDRDATSGTWVPTLRHIAKEGLCHVVGVTACLRGSDVPSDSEGRDELYAGDD